MSSSVPSPVHRPTLSKADIPTAPKYDVPPAHHRFLALPDTAPGSPSAPGSPAESLSLNDVSVPTSRSGSPVRQARTYSSACHRTGMTPMQSGDAKFQSLRSEYETAFRLIHVTMDALPAIVQALKRELRRGEGRFLDR
ncbi:hypothetical protein QFC21_003134 [Naganishia friedmannii]|uniref:Uncharacterized protein n=1 Tax=Naganishia friedmannii TaxID=89922 RepID=A0ACC2VRW7_9TREE|nr:hypothetical protein QFC21_003134 [Naganishia friedmannii]